jgi:hypothetical protein
MHRMRILDTLELKLIAAPVCVDMEMWSIDSGELSDLRDNNDGLLSSLFVISTS